MGAPLSERHIFPLTSCFSLQMFARLVATRPTVSLVSTATAIPTSTIAHAAQQHVRAFSFFSSKSGGGGDGNGNKHKYFTANSSSSRRSSPPNGANGNGGNGSAASSKPKMDGNAPTSATMVGTASTTQTADATTPAKPQPPDEPTKKGDSPPAATASQPSSSSTSNPATPSQGWTTGWQPQPMHAPLTQKDLDLHSFFSGHRPLLLLAQPSSSVFDSWPDLRLSNNPDPAVSQHQTLLNQLGGINLEDPPEATPEADADAARSLNRALVVNKLGGIVSWEETLAKLGVVEERMSSAEMGMGEGDVVDVGASMMNGFDAYMDSTRRKRRKKMKKHKLKKRRRVRHFYLHPELLLTNKFQFQLQRAQRIKIGR